MIPRTKTEEKGQCSARVYAGTFYGHPCSNRAKVVRDGKPFCGTHDPEAMAAKTRARHAEREKNWDDAQKKWEEQRERNQLIEKILGHIPTSELSNYKLVRKR